MKVSPVNADAMAKRHGIKVELASEPDAHEYASTVTLDADGVAVSCTLAGPSQTPRITALRGYRIDIVPAAHALVFEYVDRPGRIGTIGTILGEAGVNITTMQIGLKPGDEHAIVYMNVSEEVSDEVMDRLRSAMDLKNLWKISL